MSKNLMVFGLTLMVVCACFASIVAGDEPPTIGYGAIGKGGIPGCSPKNPNAKACNEVPANPYDRGCEKENRCRNGRNHNAWWSVGIASVDNVDQYNECGVME
ncbi:unnamed protein product [Dovyalis caffra]|uniref:Rapid ALkalinization Factor n=1 Tax=Dovyalis caffra TaxID=77055 RepID=A0AAV1SHW5_9ROSI|nr:unnamed protein product [Dovyalis caffra]